MRPAYDDQLAGEAAVKSENAARNLWMEVGAHDWYHTIELPYGVVTPGHFDHPRTLDRLPFPRTLRGMRCLDVGTANGFWAFAMEARGAQEVVAIDLPEAGIDVAAIMAHRQSAANLPTKPAFDLARGALGSRVRYEACSVHDLSPERHGMFDFIHVGGLLPHLRDPVGALEHVAAVCSGTVLACDAVSPVLCLLRRRPAAAFLLGQDWYWWLPNAAALRRWYEVAGFDVVRAGKPFIVRLGPGHADTSRGGRGTLRRRVAHALMRGGVPHVWLVAQPRRPEEVVP